MTESSPNQPQEPEEKLESEEEAARTPDEEPEQQTSSPDGGGQALSEALHVSFKFLKFALIGLVAFYVLNGIFWVNPGQVKIKLRFGAPVPAGAQNQYVMTPGSGWHLRWPWEQVITIPTTEQVLNADSEFWHYEPPAGQQMPQRNSLNVRRDGYLLTGDLNIVHMKLKVRYRARSDEQGALDYAFRVDNPKRLLRHFLAESVSHVAGQNEVMDIRTYEKQSVINAIEQDLRKRLRRFKERNGFTAGIEISEIDYAADPAVPTAVQQAFYQAQQARSQMNQMIAQGREQKAQVLQQGREVKAELLGEARAYKTRVVELAKADANTLEELLKYYQQSPALARIMRERHYERTIQRVLGGAREAFVLHGSQPGNQRELRVLIGRPPQTGGSSEEESEQQAQQQQQQQGNSP